ncbi:hypothetical protein GBAR_LOCUS22694 [Geodia barretti]|uniref:Uncharacterized protein n=1 Tax=Geodia barretti TaxID=519541 RepID=A0AA35X1M0_GEOBA|nr:hypothetical protein GBAR_LOCUS22694 [Geodia barretti]
MSACSWSKFCCASDCSCWTSNCCCSAYGYCCCSDSGNCCCSDNGNCCCSTCCIWNSSHIQPGSIRCEAQ